MQPIRGRGAARLRALLARGPFQDKHRPALRTRSCHRKANRDLARRQYRRQRERRHLRSSRHSPGLTGLMIARGKDMQHDNSERPELRVTDSSLARRCSAALAILLCFLVAVSAAAPMQTETGKITGTVLDPTR